MTIFVNRFGFKSRKMFRKKGIVLKLRCLNVKMLKKIHFKGILKIFVSWQHVIKCQQQRLLKMQIFYTTAVSHVAFEKQYKTRTPLEF